MLRWMKHHGTSVFVTPEWNGMECWNGRDASDPVRGAPRIFTDRPQVRRCCGSYSRQDAVRLLAAHQRPRRLLDRRYATDTWVQKERYRLLQSPLFFEARTARAASPVSPMSPRCPMVPCTASITKHWVAAADKPFTLAFPGERLWDIGHDFHVSAHDLLMVNASVDASIRRIHNLAAGTPVLLPWIRSVEAGTDPILSCSLVSLLHMRHPAGST